MGLVDKIKSDVKKSGSNRSKIFYVRDGQKARVRFLKDMDDGIEVVFHDSYERGINVPCRETYGKACDYCEDDSLRTRSQYAWPIYNYDNNEVQILMYPVNNYTPIPALMAMYETYGTLTDRDYVIGVTGKQQNKSFTVIPMDKVKFRNSKVKPLSEKAMLSIIDKAFPDDNEADNEKPRKKVRDVEDEDENWEEESESKYDDMTPKELYKLCKERNIEAEMKKSAKYYINLLEEDDEAQDDWGDDDDDYDDDEWEDE